MLISVTMTPYPFNDYVVKNLPLMKTQTVPNMCYSNILWGETIKHMILVPIHRQEWLIHRFLKLIQVCQHSCDCLVVISIILLLPTYFPHYLVCCTCNLLTFWFINQPWIVMYVVSSWCMCTSDRYILSTRFERPRSQSNNTLQSNHPVKTNYNYYPIKTDSTWFEIKATTYSFTIHAL